MKATLLKAVLLTSLIVLGFGCSPRTEPSEKPFVATQTAQTSAKEPWEAEWGKTVAAAKNEGTLVAYTIQVTEFTIPVAKAFKEKFNIDTEWVVGRGADILPKLTQERRAGLYLANVMLSGVSTLNTLIAEGAVEAMEPALI